MASSANPLSSSRSDYILKPHFTNLFFIEPVHKNIKDPIQLANFFFPPGWHFVPMHPDKSITFYKDILLKHQSIVIKPIFDKRSPNKIIYHSLYIHNIVSLDECGHPSLLRDLPNHSIKYSYYDYMEAWFKILLHQNESFLHSWFFQFDHKFKSVIPSWFLKWWEFHGALPEILPADLFDQVTIFSTKYKITDHYSHFPFLLLFMAKYKVPWIFKWQYFIHNHIVIRQHYVKWWDAFKHPRVIEQVKLEFPVLAPTPVTTVPAAPAATRSPYSTMKLDSPSTSSKTSKPKQSKTKSSKSKSPSPAFIQDNTELLRVANLLLAQVQAQAQAQVQSTIKEESASSNSSTAQSAQSESPDPYGSQFQDAQDPFA